MTYKWDEMTQFERDGLVAEKFEGLTNIRETNNGWKCDGFNDHGDVVSYHLLSYSTFTSSAMKLLDDFWEWRLFKSDTRGYLCYVMTYDRREYRGEGATLSEAICKAVLRSVNVNIE